MLVYREGQPSLISIFSDKVQAIKSRGEHGSEHTTERDHHLTGHESDHPAQAERH